MVATTDGAEKAKPVSGNKVSKPLMEKKRRARINQCLEQLKSLLESYYSSSIRKRKLEKADILELTVKHLKNLQRMQNYVSAASDDYHKGFHSCLENFSHYLLMSENLNMGDHSMLSQVSNKLWRSQRRSEQHSTSDSSPGLADAQKGATQLVEAAAGPKERESSKPAPHRLHGADRDVLKHAEDAWQSDGNRAAPHKDGNISIQLCNTPSLLSSHSIVWRPW